MNVWFTSAREFRSQRKKSVQTQLRKQTRTQRMCVAQGAVRGTVPKHAKNGARSRKPRDGLTKRGPSGIKERNKNAEAA